MNNTNPLYYLEEALGASTHRVKAIINNVKKSGGIKKSIERSKKYLEKKDSHDLKIFKKNIQDYVLKPLYDKRGWQYKTYWK